MFFFKRIKPEDRRNWLYDGLASYCNTNGFTLLPHKNQFRKRTELGFQTIILSTSHYDKTTVFELHVGIRNQVIEKTAFQFTNGLPLFQRDSMSLVTAIGKLEGQPYQRYDIVKKEDAEKAVEKVTEQLERFGRNWLEQHQSMASIHQLLNQLPLVKTPYMPNQIYRCFRGLVAARLVNSNNYEMIEKEYNVFLQKLSAPDYQLSIWDRLKIFLNNNSAN
ncbi:MAG: hypothetical protein AAGF77_13780 [Bacteroidota bacterium]